MPLPEKEFLLLKVPLYEKVPVSQNDFDYLWDFFFDGFVIDTFCPSCNSKSTFKPVDYSEVTHYYLAQKHNYGYDKSSVSFKKITNRIFSNAYLCSRNDGHKAIFDFWLAEDHLVKIGQYPSFADSSLPEYKKYKKVLGENLYKEFTKGVGLISHGIGAGSFVYVRRVFEFLIEDAHQLAKQDIGWNETAYSKAKMEEKISVLKLHLPSFLVENRKLYGILSKGIHELSEEDCLEYFEPVKVAIELILDEKLDMIRKIEKIRSAKSALQGIGQKLTKNNSEQ